MNADKVAVITGGTRGIGAAMADLFEASGYSLLLTGTQPEIIAQRNQSCSTNRHYIQVDFAVSETLDAFLEYVSRLNRLDVCINNAGINIIKPMDEVSQKDLDRITMVNYRAPYLISQVAARVMKRGGFGGRILNVASIWSEISKPGRSLYSAAKTGVLGMTRAMAVELAPCGILVNAISPGFTLTDLTRKSLSEEERKQLAGQVPLGRLAEPEEIARLAFFLCSENNTYITGQNILIDGGFTQV